MEYYKERSKFTKSEVFKGFVMPVPKGKVSKSRKRQRSANKGVEIKVFAECKNCNATAQPHQVCYDCGYYKGIKVIRTKDERAQERGKQRKEIEDKYKQKMASSQGKDVAIKATTKDEENQ